MLAGRDESVNLFVEGLLPHSSSITLALLMENDSFRGIDGIATRHSLT